MPPLLPKHFLRFVPFLAAALCCVATPFAQAEGEPASLSAQAKTFADRYLGNGFSTLPQAKAALAEAATTHAMIAEQVAAEENTCRTRFFVTACIDAVHEEQRHAIAIVRSVELAAQRYQRVERVAERDRALQQK